MKKTVKILSSALLSASMLVGVQVGPASAVGEGPGYGGNETIKNERLHNYEEMVKFLEKQDHKSAELTLEVYGQSVKGRDLYLAKFGENPENPTILFLTQQHGNETLTTEGALKMIQQLTSNSREVQSMLEKVNVLFVPRLNVDGAEGDVNFSLEDYVAGTHTRYNANKVDLNRDHIALEQPETRAFHENVLQKYQPDYMIDFHHQGTQTTLGDSDELVSGSILHPTNPDVAPEVVDGSKRLGSVVYDAVEAKGYATLSKYRGGTAPKIGRNGIALQYDISTLLIEVRGMADHYYEPYVLGQKSNGYLIKQAVVAMEASIKAIADGSIETADTSFWDSLPESGYRGE
ncbi:M14 family metallopeptidase [Pseudalkalibacillus decolorationis]|uniref:M14 family metallopeptidase n=1 Tax=Pseudalkalibacillus decolorationis TaxID=163879 RepID=UPI0021486DB5|nr:M14 family metallopeptidase [Pseudalkalibacillus decolorationis]